MLTDLKKQTYSKDWTNPDQFPTFEDDETQIRADIMYLPEEIRLWLNSVLDSVIAENIPFEEQEFIPAVTIQAAIENLKQQLDEAVIGGIVPDGSITTAKLADGAVTRVKLGSDVQIEIPDGSITAAKLAADSVTRAKIEDYAIDSSKLASYSVTTGKLDDGAVTYPKTTGLQREGTFIEEAEITFSGLYGTFSDSRITEDSVCLFTPCDSTWSNWKTYGIHFHSVGNGYIKFKSDNACSATMKANLVLFS